MSASGQIRAIHFSPNGDLKHVTVFLPISESTVHLKLSRAYEAKGLEVGHLYRVTSWKCKDIPKPTSESPRPYLTKVHQAIRAVGELLDLSVEQTHWL